MILLIDNYDSFTYNLYQYLCQLGAEVVVKRNDEIDIPGIEAMAPEKIVVSPGPSSPPQADLQRGHQALQPQNPGTGRLSRPPVYGVRLRRRSGAGQVGDARQGFIDRTLR